MIGGIICRTMSTQGVARPDVAGAGRTVLKLGTRVLTHDDGRVALSRVFAVVETAASLHREGKQVLIVSSGAVGMGRDVLGFERIPQDLEDRQACAAVGQSRLMGMYQEGFSRLGITCGQVLLNQSDFHDRVRYLNLRSTLSTLLRRRVIPIINENDAVSTEELAFVEGEPRQIFGDNDKLSALVATKLDSELLVLLTDVEGVYDKDPRRHRQVRLLSRVDDADELRPDPHASRSKSGRGGMRTKIEAASIAAKAGCHAVIACGLDPTVLPRVLAGEDVGTWFPARATLDARRRWIAFAVAPRGTLRLDAGAVAAVRKRGASVLAAGVQQCDGDFKQGDVVELRDLEGGLVGRGIVFCDATTARKWCAGTRPGGVRNHHALVHRDHLVLETQK